MASPGGAADAALGAPPVPGPTGEANGQAPAAGLAAAGHGPPALSGLPGDARAMFDAAAAAGVRGEVLARAARRVQALLQP